jgi:trimeric autotransporter adhesin
MKKILLVVTAFITSINLNAQVTGVKTIPTDYPTLQAVVAALNASGVGVGGATINIPAGYTETPTAQMVLTMTVNASTNANPLVFQKSGAGANPLITAFTPGISTTVDGVFILNGADYVTINGIDLQENAVNTTPTTQMEWGYALTKQNATDGANNNVIKNCSVTLSNANTASTGIYVGNHLFNVTTALTITNFSGTSSKNKFYNNSIQNCYIGYSITGFAAAAPYDFYDQDNTIGVDGISTRRSQVINFGGGALATNGIFATNQNGIKVFSTFINNLSGPASTGAVNGINLVTGLNSNVDVYNDTLNLTSNSTSGSQLYGITSTMGGTGAGNTVNIYNNVISNCTYPTNTTGVFRGINNGATATYCNMYNNKIINNTIAGTGDFNGLYYGGSSATLVLDVKLYNNVIDNNIKTGTSGAFYGIFASASTYSTKTYSNQVSNNSAAASSSGFYGYYNFAFGFNESIYSNQFYNNTGGSGEVVMVIARSGSGPTNKDVYNNTIYNIIGNTTSNFGAIWVDYATIGSVYRNNIYNLTNNTTTGATPAVFGINIGSNVNTQVSTYTNFISDLKAPNVNNGNAIYGIWLQGSVGASILNAYYNTVYLSGTSVGANFGTAALACETAPLSIDLRNNILVNTCTTTGTGFTRALKRGNTTITNYNTLSGYNCLFAGTPSASNLIYSDGTNNVQTLQGFKNLVGPREQASFSSLPPFVNVATTPYDLHLQTGTPTQCEGGGTPVAGITLDYDNATRNATLPDVGADEFAGTTIDIASPNIQYNLLTNSSVATTRNLSAFATITDPSGINNTTGTKPRLYYKKSTHLNTFNTNTNATDGWKFVETSNTSSPYNFAIDYTLLFSGSVVAGDVINYFVTAQDLNATPRIGLNNGGFTAQPTNVNLAAGNFPLLNTINQYNIVSAALSGTVNVGPTELITSLTNAGGAFAGINASVLSGNLTLNITGDLTAETGLNALNQWAEEGAGNYSVTIVPSAAVTRTISGTNATASLIRFDGADRVTIDGRFASSGTFLTFRNTSNASPTISFINDAQNNTVQYAIIESGNTGISATLGGAIFIGGTTGLNGNDNITIANCDIRDRSDVVGTPAIAISCVGNAGALTQYNNNVTISNNKIYNWFLVNSNVQNAINIGVGNTNFTITGNSFYQTVARTQTASGAITRAINYSFSSPVNTNGGNVITNNYIGGTAPLCAGGNMTLTVSGAGVSQVFTGMNIGTGQIPNSIQNNVIRGIDFTTNSPTAAASVWLGINVGNGIHAVGTQTGNVIGAPTGNGALKITVNAGGAVSSFLAGIQSGAVNGYADIRNNSIGGINIAGSTTAGGIIPQWIQSQGTPQSTITISNNLIGSLTTANSISNSANATIISFGIRQVITTGAPLTISNNTVMNVTDNSAVATSINIGLNVPSTVGGAAPLTITNNLIKNISINATTASPSFANTGIAIQNYSGILHTIESNTITGLTCANTGVAFGYAVGMQLQGNGLGGVISKNYINDLRNNNTGNCGVQGIYFNSGLDWNVNNNMISVSNGTNTNNVDMAAITDFMAANSNLKLYYNSLYVGGNNGTGTTNSAAYNRGGSANIDFKNNLLYNERASTTSSHVAISNANNATGWSANNNAYIVSDTTKVGSWLGTSSNFNTWKTNSGGDANSAKSINSVVTNTTLFVSSTNGDLHINTSTFPAGLGTPISITTDIDGNARGLISPAVGADEIACVAPVVSVASQSNVTCFAGTNGSATVTATNGTSFTYSWLPSGGTTASASGLAAGVYTVNVTNNCAIVTSQTLTITQPSSITVMAVASNTSICTGNSSTLTANATGGTGAITYTWVAGPTNNVSVVSPTANTVYTVNVTDANSCTKSQTVNVIVNATPTIAVTNGTICSGQSFTLVPSGASTYTFSSGSAIVSPTINATYSVTGTSALGCVGSNTATSNVTVNATPTISVNSGSICAGNSFTIVPSGANTYTVQGGTTVVSPTSNTSYTVIGISTQGCVSANTATSSVVVNATPTITAASQTICAGATTTLVASGATTYTWSTTASTNTISVSPSSTTVYTVNGTNASGCLGTVQNVTVTIGAAPSIAVNSATICSGNTATLIASGVNTFTWSNGAITNSIVVSPTTNTVYTVNGNLVGCAVSATNTASVNVNASPSVSVVSTNTTLCGGGTTTLTATGATSYVWSTSATSPSIVVTPTVNTTYSVTGTNSNGCSKTNTVTAFANAATSLTVATSNSIICIGETSTITATGANTYTISGGSFVTTPTITTNYTVTGTTSSGCVLSNTVTQAVGACVGVKELTNTTSFSIYPNPNNGAFIIELGTNAKVIITNALSQEFMNTNLEVGSHNINLYDVANGIYFIKVISGNTQTTKRLVISK